MLHWSTSSCCSAFERPLRSPPVALFTSAITEGQMELSLLALQILFLGRRCLDFTFNRQKPAVQYVHLRDFTNRIVYAGWVNNWASSSGDNGQDTKPWRWVP